MFGRELSEHYLISEAGQDCAQLSWLVGAREFDQLARQRLLSVREWPVVGTSEKAFNFAPSLLGFKL
ncbi:hypothetical protein D3C77_408560 [compost metagenome]